MAIQPIMAIQPNMDFMVEESFPCMSHCCDKVFYVKSDIKKHAKAHAKDKLLLVLQ